MRNKKNVYFFSLFFSLSLFPVSIRLISCANSKTNWNRALEPRNKCGSSHTYTIAWTAQSAVQWDRMREQCIPNREAHIHTHTIASIIKNRHIHTLWQQINNKTHFTQMKQRSACLFEFNVTRLGRSTLKNIALWNTNIAFLVAITAVAAATAHAVIVVAVVIVPNIWFLAFRLFLSLNTVYFTMLRSRLRSIRK